MIDNIPEMTPAWLVQFGTWVSQLKPSELIGIYGAVIASVTWIVKLVSWLNSFKSKIRVRATVGNIATFGPDQPTLSVPVLQVNIINRSPYSVTISGVYFRRRWRREMLAAMGQFTRLPLEIKPHAAENVFIPWTFVTESPLLGSSWRPFVANTLGETFWGRTVKVTKPSPGVEATPPEQGPDSLKG